MKPFKLDKTLLTLKLPDIYITNFIIITNTKLKHVPQFEFFRLIKKIPEY